MQLLEFVSNPLMFQRVIVLHSPDLSSRTTSQDGEMACLSLRFVKEPTGS